MKLEKEEYSRICDFIKKIKKHKLQNNSMLVKVNSNENISSDKIIVPLNVIMTNVSVSKDDFNIGDIVKVYYDKTIDYNEPAQVNHVYAIFEERISKENLN